MLQRLKEQSTKVLKGSSKALGKTGKENRQSVDGEKAKVRAGG